jgi:pyruvate/oxaloacetate carboxyltransferase
MKITRRQLRKIIKETVDMALPAKEVMTPDYVLNALTKGKSVRSGVPFLNTAMDGIAAGDGRTAANAVMDALWVDDPPPGASEELENIVLDAKDEDDLAAIAAEWGTRHFRSR